MIAGLSNLLGSAGGQNAMLTAALGGLGRYMDTPEKNRQMQLNAAMARWSPYTKDMSWADEARKGRKSGTQSVWDDLSKGYRAKPGSKEDLNTLFKGLKNTWQGYQPTLNPQAAQQLPGSSVQMGQVASPMAAQAGGYRGQGGSLPVDYNRMLSEMGM